jgi:putative NADH-flavin reductase
MKLFTSLLLLFYVSFAGLQATAFISKEMLYPALKGYNAKQADILQIQQKTRALQKKYEAIVNPYSSKQKKTMKPLRET